MHLPPAESKKTFTVEMAPLDVMPHAVHLFLEQVLHGLWNNAWFYINGPHVLQAGPQADEAELDKAIEKSGSEEVDERSIALRPFRDIGLESLSFPEYSDQFPHAPWTLGFTGRPGGPDWYINKMDNSESHGPGGQYHHDISESADACFARVYSGFETLDAIFQTPVVTDDPQYKYFFDEPIHITKAIVLQTPPIQSARDMQMLNLTEEQMKQKLQQQQQQRATLAQGNIGVDATGNAKAQAEDVVTVEHSHGGKPKRRFHKPEDFVEP